MAIAASAETYTRRDLFTESMHRVLGGFDFSLDSDNTYGTDAPHTTHEAPRLTRRNFLKLAALTGAAVVAPNFNGLKRYINSALPKFDELTRDLLLEENMTQEHRDIFMAAAKRERVYVKKRDSDEETDFTAAIAEALIPKPNTITFTVNLPDVDSKYIKDVSYITAALAGYRAGLLGIPEEEYEDQLKLAAAVSIVNQQDLEKKMW